MVGAVSQIETTEEELKDTLATLRDLDKRNLLTSSHQFRIKRNKNLLQIH
jgi:hypothetical protein